MTKLAAQINQIIKLLLPIVGPLIILSITTQDGLCTVNARENDVVKTVRKVSPAVVNISSQYEIRKNSNPFSGYGMDPLLEKFFEDFFSPELERREKRSSLGSGVIIDGSRGLVLTNAHVVEKASTIKVALNGGEEFEAFIVGMDPDSDLAVLKIGSDGDLPAIQMGDSDNIMIGESVIAIGNPFGFSHTVTTGVVSAVGRSIKTTQRVFHEFIQTDASINPGNSGGPLLNINGELIGINTAIYAQAQGIGFAIPINRAKRIISDLVNYGEVVQAWIGITVQPLDPELAEYLNLQPNLGIMVTAVDEKSPAATAGINEGDILLSIDEQGIIDLSDYRRKVKALSAAQTISFRINRKGKALDVSVETSIFPLDRALEMTGRRLGITVAELDERVRAKYGIRTQTGVLILKMIRGSQLDLIGVRPGDIIRQVDESRIDNLTDFKAAIVKYRQKSSLVLLIQRNGQLYYINATMKGDGQ